MKTPLEPTTRRKRALFLCTGNSARSQMAEAVMRQLGGNKVDVVSAGTDPRPEVHPEALRTLQRHHVATDGLTPKNVSTFEGRAFDYVITVCDQANEQCPVFLGAEMIHWSFEDPAAASEAKQQQAFEAVFQGLSKRIQLLLIVNDRS